MVKDELFKMLDMASKLTDIDRLILSCGTLNNGGKLRRILGKLKNELAEHIIEYYDKNYDENGVCIEPHLPKVKPLTEIIDKSTDKLKPVNSKIANENSDDLKRIGPSIDSAKVNSKIERLREANKPKKGK